jgi:hypothetical protein
MSDAPHLKKPEIVKPQKWGDNSPRGSDMKKSILADVDKQIVVNTSGKSGGS